MMRIHHCSSKTKQVKTVQGHILPKASWGGICLALTLWDDIYPTGRETMTLKLFAEHEINILVWHIYELWEKMGGLEGGNNKSFPCMVWLTGVRFCAISWLEDTDSSNHTYPLVKLILSPAMYLYKTPPVFAVFGISNGIFFHALNSRGIWR